MPGKWRNVDFPASGVVDSALTIRMWDGGLVAEPRSNATSRVALLEGMTMWNFTEPRWIHALIVTVAAGCFACGDDSESVPPSQGPSEQCDPSHGIDACGAGLFCAAFDGRKVDTCYVLGSRLRDEECGDNSHCSSKNCVDNHCGGAPLDGPCISDKDCESGTCGSIGKTCI